MAEKQTICGETLDKATTILKALADTNRLRVLDLLMQGDSCNCELNDRLGLPPNLLSHHLRILRKAGLIHSRRDAVDSRWIYYAVDRKEISRWRNWFDEFFDPARIQPRLVLCGPEGQLTTDERVQPTKGK
ncbi:MAG: winged helix-turn-helix transcriptional regulator [Anaerolineae bacterium]|nr:winged helix-turn-helix transcriptional regulator [Anaerolineae bacterium]